MGYVDTGVLLLLSLHPINTRGAYLWHRRPPPPDPHSQFGKVMLIKHVCSSSELTDVCWKFGLNACFFGGRGGLRCVARAQNDRRAACTASGETRWRPDFQFRLLVWLKRLPPVSDWLAAFCSGCQILSSRIYSFCHRMPYSSRWNISGLN